MAIITGSHGERDGVTNDPTRSHSHIGRGSDHTAHLPSHPEGDPMNQDRKDKETRRKMRQQLNREQRDRKRKEKKKAEAKG